MIPVRSPQFVMDQTETVKFVSRTLMTNFYFNKDMLDYWTRMALLFHEKIGETAFFFKKDLDFFHLYYVSPSYDELGRGLEALSSRPAIFATDVITKIGEGVAVLDIFHDHGFYRYRTLVRMCMTKSPHSQKTADSAEIRFARKDDIDKLHDILTGNFDRYAEQIPSTDEIAMDVENNKIIVKEKNGVIAGLIHYDLIGLTSHLRRWFVNPDYRDQHVGSKLLRSYFSLSHKATRFILWVLQANENAIKRYLHYGYREDNLIDTIFINQEQVNRGK